MTALSHGLALWNPNPLKEIYDKVSIGDVGYLHEGSFIRMFNVMLPWSHDSNRTLGEPEPYQSLDCGRFANTFKRQFDRVKYCSRHVSAETNACNGHIMTPEECHVYVPESRSTFVSSKRGHHEDVIRAQAFQDYIQDYADSWFTWARKNRLAVERVEDLILVSGCTLVTSWAAAAFVDNTIEAEISLTSRTLSNVRTSFVWGNVRGMCRITTVVSTQFVPQTYVLLGILLILLKSKTHPRWQINASLSGVSEQSAPSSGSGQSELK
ncbi:hypothetical protein BGY98DRAFT_1100565 [Russula aff. rugulosa BPL654]|nr:hypothetical protein BGY98DRAFT_1100565 [Russula aff. rugulosa BPL654]